jgi:hypothetical protein
MTQKNVVGIIFMNKCLGNPSIANCTVGEIHESPLRRATINVVTVESTEVKA